MGKWLLFTIVRKHIFHSKLTCVTIHEIRKQLEKIYVVLLWEMLMFGAF